MGSEEARRFRESIGGIGSDQQAINLGNSAKRKVERQRFIVPKGTAQQMQQSVKKKKRKLNLKLLALLVAAGIGTGIAGIKVSGVLNPKPRLTVTQLQERGIDTGLENDTLEKMIEYDKYFNAFDKDAVTDLTEDEVLAMIDDISQLNEEALEEKVADLVGVSADSVDIAIGHSDDIGPCPRVTVDKGEETQSYVDDQNFLLGIGKNNSIPDKISNLILQTRDYQDLKDDVLQDKITKNNAIKKLKNLYNKISGVVTSELSIDEKGNITTGQYDKPIQQEEKSAEEKDNDEGR